MTTPQLVALIVVLGILGFLLAVRRRQSTTDDVTIGKSQLDRWELELDAQRKSIDFQRKEIGRLEKLNTDQDKQIRTLLESGASLADVEQYARTKKEYDQMKGDMDKIALYIRENMKTEIAEGRHAGMSLAEVCVMYMRRGKMTKEIV